MFGNGRLSLHYEKKIGYNIVRSYKILKTGEDTKQLVYVSDSENTAQWFERNNVSSCHIFIRSPVY